MAHLKTTCIKINAKPFIANSGVMGEGWKAGRKVTAAQPFIPGIAASFAYASA